MLIHVWLLGVLPILTQSVETGLVVIQSGLRAEKNIEVALIQDAWKNPQIDVQADPVWVKASKAVKRVSQRPAWTKVSTPGGRTAEQHQGEPTDAEHPDNTGGSGGDVEARRGGMGEDIGQQMFVSWQRSVVRCIERKVVYPTERAIAMDQGLVLHRLSIKRDGHLYAAPRLLQSSGFADMDLAVRIAIERCAPFAPVPKHIERDRPVVTLNIPYEMSNPMFR